MALPDVTRRGVCENPFDDVLRLEHADRLHASGVPDHRLLAEFIRWQLATARGPCPVPTAFVRHHFRMFLKRPKFYPGSFHPVGKEVILQERWVPDGRAPVDLWLEEVIITRGFVSAVQCHVNRWVRSGPRIVSEHPLSELTLRGIWMDSMRHSDRGGEVRLTGRVPPFASATAYPFETEVYEVEYRLNYEALVWARAAAGLPPFS